MMIRNILCIILVMSVVDLHLTSGRNVNDVVIDQRDDVDDELSFDDDTGAPTEHADSEVIENIFNPLDHLLLSREKRKAIKYLSMRWTRNEIPFEIDYSQFTNNDTNVIFQAMNEWQLYTCLKFRPHRRGDKHFVRFINGDGCYSNVGMAGTVQIISLGTDECVTRETVLHEIGHAVGFYHEQSRPDRDMFVTILETKIQKGQLYNFNKKAGINTYGLPYDYTSIMHYIDTAFSKVKDQVTIKTKDPNFQKVIGKATHLSFYDVNLANLMYKCSQKCHPSIKCPSNGFLGPNCECWCRGEKHIQTCDSSDPILVDDLKPPSKRWCQVLSESCQSWKTTNKCTDYEMYCPMYCSHCDRLLGQ